MITKAPWYDNVVEAFSYDAYYCCIGASTHADPDESTTYERDYGPFEKRIARVLKEHGVPKEAIDFFDDWCPNRWRDLWVEEKYVTPAAVVGLYGLLRRKYERWRIDVTLVGTIRKNDERGKIAQQHGWVLCYKTGRKLVRDVKRTLG